MIDKFHRSYTPVTETGCWIWDHCGGEKQRYGSIYNPETKGMERCNRFSYRLHKGEIPEGLVVRHKCDTTFCVNPDHLELGTQRDNVKDTSDRRRWDCRKGSNNNNVKLSEEDVEYIRSQPKRAKNGRGGGVSNIELAKEFSMSEQTIYKIRSNLLHISRLEYDPS